MSWEHRLALKPYVFASGATLAKRQGYEDYAYSNGAGIGAAAFHLRPEQAIEVENRRMDGNAVLYQLGRPKKQLSIDLSHVSAAKLATVLAMLRSGRPLAVGAWYDDSTHWMSHFGGVDGRLGYGVAQVGYNASTMGVRRDLAAADYVQHPYAGANVLLRPATAPYVLPKIVPGMIGGALLCETNRFNRAVRRVATVGAPIFSVVGSAQTVVTSVLDSCLVSLTAATQILYLPYTGVAASTHYCKSVTETGVLTGNANTVTVWARGSGSFQMAWYQSGTQVAISNSLQLTDDWQPFSLTFTPSTTGEVRLFCDVAGGSGSAQMQVACYQIEDGAGGTSFMDYTSAGTNGDCLQIVDSPAPAGLTYAAWFKYRNDNDVKYLFSMSGTGGNYYLTVQGTTVTFNFGASSIQATISSALAGTWVQLVLTIGGGATTLVPAVAKVYINGAQANQGDIQYPLQVPSGSTDNTLYLGSSRALGSGLGFNMPLDSFRIDERPWTAAEVLDDYALRSDAGMQMFLSQVQGRYFKADLTSSPAAGVFTDVHDGDLSLREIETLAQSVP